MKLTENSGYRVAIEPTFLFGRTDMERCEEIARVVELSITGKVTIEHDTTHVCSHCRAPWTEVSETYNGGCCAADEDSQPTKGD